MVDEPGDPVQPEWYSNEFQRSSRRAEVPRIVPDESRHTALSVRFNVNVRSEVAVGHRAPWPR